MKMHFRSSSPISVSLPENLEDLVKKKFCTGCNKLLELIPENYHKDPYRRNGFDIYCRKCRSKMKKIYGNRIKQHNKEVSNV
jgi:hypothetical protein